MKHLKHDTVWKIIAIACLAVFSLSACQKQETTNSDDTQQRPEPRKNDQQIAAEKIINDNPDIIIVEVVGDNKLHIRNKHTMLGMILPFQDIIDGKYDSIKTAPEKTTKAAQNSTQPGEVKNISDSWGQTPDWIPHIKDAKVRPNSMHKKKEDESIWGQLTFTHPDPVDKLSQNIKSEMVKKGLKLHAEESNEGKTFFIFASPNHTKATGPEKRQASYMLKRKDSNTYVTIQYSQGGKKQP